MNFSEIQVRAAFDVQIEDVPAVVDVQRGVDPVLAPRDDLAVLPEQAVANGERRDAPTRMPTRTSAIAGKANKTLAPDQPLVPGASI